MMKKKLLNNIFLKDTFTLVLGTGMAQAIALIAQLITRRLYEPADFGAFAVYFSVVSILVSVVSLQYSKAIVLPKFTKISTNLLAGTVLIIFLFSFLLALAFFVFPSFFIHILKFPKSYSYWIYFIPLSVFLFATYEALNYWLIRGKAFKASAINKIARRTAEGGTQVAIGAFNKSFGLVIGDVLGNLINCFSGVFQAKKVGLKYKDVSPKLMKLTLLRYKDFPKFYAIPTVLNTISLFLPILILNKFYSEEIVGFFDLSRMILAVPLALITTSLSQVLFQRISEKKNNEHSIKKDILGLAGLLTTLVLIGILIIELFAPDIFQLFGKQYVVSGKYTQILVFSFGIKFIVSPLAIVFPALERIKVGALWQIIYFLLLFVLFFFDNLDIFDFLKLLVVIELVCYTVYFVFILTVTFQYEKTLKKR